MRGRAIQASTSAKEVVSLEELSVNEETRINDRCVFGSSVWPLYSRTSKKAIVAGHYRVSIDWARIEARLANDIVYDLKIFAYVYICHYRKIGRRRAPDAETVVSRVRAIVTAISRMTEHHAEGLSLASFSLDTVVSYLSGAKNLLQVRPALTLLSHSYMKKVLKGRGFPFAMIDLKRALRRKSAKPPQVDSTSATLEIPKVGYQVLPAPLFAFFTRENQSIVGTFLSLMGKGLRDVHFNEELIQEGRRGWKKFKRAFAAYIEIRGKTRREGDKKKRDEMRAKLSDSFVEKFGFSISEFGDFLDDVQMASISQILLYTGMRYEEITLLAVGCLKENQWGMSIHSDVLKHRKRGEQEADGPGDLYDRWVATDILIDAVAALEALSRIKETRWLTATVNGNQADRKGEAMPMKNQALNTRLRRYLSRIDKSKAFANWRLHCHQFREGLVDQLARMEVRLSYISIQLKHLSYAAQVASRGIPAKETLGYGNIPRVLLASLTGADAVERARMEVALGLYGEGKNFAGAGAETHRQRTEAFFQGMALSGQARVDFIRELARKPLPIFVSGVGVCTLNLADSSTADRTPPCLGDLHCNPRDCDNSVVPETHRTAIEKRLAKARKNASDPNLSHAREFYEEQVSIYESMLAQLSAGCV